jgi:hypothetical protein
MSFFILYKPLIERNRMKIIICLVLLVVSCGSLILPSDNVVVSKCETRSDGTCSFTLKIPESPNIYLNGFPCDCFKVADTVRFARLGKMEKAATCAQQSQERHYPKCHDRWCDSIITGIIAVDSLGNLFK